MSNETIVLGGAPLKAKQSAFLYVKAKNSYLECDKKKDDITQGLGESPTTYNTIISVAIVFAALALCYAEAYNSNESLQGLGFSQAASIIIGVTLACIALKGGHEIAAGMQERDPFSNKRIYSKQFYFGIFLCLFNLAAQFFISISASDGAENMLVYNIFVVLIGLLEVFVGASLKSAIQTLTYRCVNVRQRFLFKRMYKHSKHTDTWWQRYLFDVSKSLIPTTPMIEPPAVKEARKFYESGVVENEVETI